MITILACCFLFVLICVTLNYNVAYKNALDELVVYCDEIKLRNLILFSNEDIARAIVKRFDNGERIVKIYYFNNHYIKINNTESKESIKRRIESIQDFIIEKLDLKLDNSLIKNKTDDIIMRVWINYGYNQRYRKIFRSELEGMIENGNISKFIYNEIYRRFYKFEENNRLD